MKKFVLILPMLLAARLCLAEAGKGIHLSRGFIIGIMLIGFAITAAVLYGVSRLVFAMLNASVGRRRASHMGTFVGSIMGTMFGVIVELMVQDERYQDPSVWPILIAAVFGMTFGFAFSPRKKDDILDQ